MDNQNSNLDIDLVPLAASPAPKLDTRDQQPSRVSNTLEHQMQLNVDPRLPRGEPQLVGLSRFRYDPSQLPVEPHHTTVAQNYSKLQSC